MSLVLPAETYRKRLLELLHEMQGGHTPQASQALYNEVMANYQAAHPFAWEYAPIESPAPKGRGRPPKQPRVQQWAQPATRPPGARRADYSNLIAAISKPATL